MGGDSDANKLCPSVEVEVLAARKVAVLARLAGYTALIAVMSFRKIPGYWNMKNAQSQGHTSSGLHS